MNEDQVEGTVKEKVGELTDDESTEAEGKAQRAWGDLEEKAGDVKEKIAEKL